MEKKDVLAAELSADVSCNKLVESQHFPNNLKICLFSGNHQIWAIFLHTCEERGTPYWLVGAGRRVCPEWKVDLKSKKLTDLVVIWVD